MSCLCCNLAQSQQVQSGKVGVRMCSFVSNVSTVGKAPCKIQHEMTHQVEAELFENSQARPG